MSNICGPFGLKITRASDRPAVDILSLGFIITIWRLRHLHFQITRYLLMLKRILAALCCFCVVAGFGCGPSANSNANPSRTLDNANLPPGLSVSPVPPSSNSTPGIPANFGQLPKGATPTPGIPDPKTLNKPFKPGATPTPGIPSLEELRRQMNNPGNINIPPANGVIPMIQNKRKLHPGKPQ